MKFILPLIAVLFALNAQASSIRFPQESNLPSALQVMVARTLETRCPKFFNIMEKATSVTSKEIDQGQRDFFYSTYFTGSYHFDGMHPVFVEITVESASYDIRNPNFANFEILSVKTSSPDGCN